MGDMPSAPTWWFWMIIGGGSLLGLVLIEFVV